MLHKNQILNLFHKGILGLDAAEFYQTQGWYFVIKNGQITDMRREEEAC